MCFSGGGFRACSQTIGWLRALNKLGILQKARYISTVSGASWAVAPMATFSSAGEIEKYLGKYVPPEECSVNALKKVDGLLQVMVKANCVQKFVEKMFTTFDNDERDFWSTAVGDIFFQDYKVNNPRTIPVIGNHQSAANKKVSSFSFLNADFSFDFFLIYIFLSWLRHLMLTRNWAIT